MNSDKTFDSLTIVVILIVGLFLRMPPFEVTTMAIGMLVLFRIIDIKEILEKED